MSALKIASLEAQVIRKDKYIRQLEQALKDAHAAVHKLAPSNPIDLGSSNDNSWRPTNHPFYEDDL
jgi:hypothetical protein